MKKVLDLIQKIEDLNDVPKVYWLKGQKAVLEEVIRIYSEKGDQAEVLVFTQKIEMVQSSRLYRMSLF